MNLGTERIEKSTYEDIPQMIEMSLVHWGEIGTFSEERYKELIDHNLGFTMKDNQDNKILGYCLCEEEKEGLVGITIIAIAKGYTGRGLGRKLLKHTLDFCESFGYTKFCLYVEVNNTIAVNLYKSLRFAIDKTVLKYYEQGEDAYYMIKTEEQTNNYSREDS